MTSYLFREAKFSQERLNSLLFDTLGGDVSKLVIDLSCRRQGDIWVVAMNKWQTLTDMEVNRGDMKDGNPPVQRADGHTGTIKSLEKFCSEFLIHAADNEGLQRGIDEELVEKLGTWCSKPVTYAGGGKSLGDLDRVKKLSAGRVDLTIGSALDIFGGEAVSLSDCVKWNRQQDC